MRAARASRVRPCSSSVCGPRRARGGGSELCVGDPRVVVPRAPRAEPGGGRGARGGAGPSLPRPRSPAGSFPPLAASSPCRRSQSHGHFPPVTGVGGRGWEAPRGAPRIAFLQAWPLTLRPGSSRAPPSRRAHLCVQEAFQPPACPRLQGRNKWCYKTERKSRSRVVEGASLRRPPPPPASGLLGRRCPKQTETAASGGQAVSPDSSLMRPLALSPSLLSGSSHSLPGLVGSVAQLEAELDPGGGPRLLGWSPGVEGCVWLATSWGPVVRVTSGPGGHSMHR